MRFEDRTAVVTGATKGLGRDTALLMAGEGGRVIGIGRDIRCNCVLPGDMERPR